MKVIQYSALSKPRNRTVIVPKDNSEIAGITVASVILIACLMAAPVLVNRNNITMQELNQRAYAQSTIEQNR